MPRKDTQKEKECQQKETQKETQKEKEGLQDDEVSNKDLKDLFSRLIKKLDESLSARLTALEGKVDDALTGELKQVNESLQNHEDRLAELEKQQNEVINPQVDKMDTLEDALKELQDRIIQQEARSRKYNLLFYGIPKQTGEVTHDIIVKFLHEKLSISLESAESILIENSHRVQKNPKSAYKPDAPEAVIVKFVRMEDRNMILNLARFKTLPKGYAVRTDLPVHLKKKRGELARKAYELRKSGRKTRIRETKDDVILEYRPRDGKEWLTYKASV